MQIRRHYDEPATDDNGVFDTTIRLSTKEKQYVCIALDHYLKELSEDAEYFAEQIQDIKQMIQAL